MKKTHGTVLSSLVLSGAVLVMAPHAWGQTGGSSGAASPRGSETQKSGDASGTSSSQRSGSSSGMSSSSEQGQSGTSARRTSGQRISKDQVKQVQSALKSKGMDPGPEDGVMGPKTQSALREFQKSNNLQATGRLDEKTASALGVDMASSGMSGSSAGSASGSGSSSGMGSSSGTGAGSSGATGSGSGSSAGTGSGAGKSSSSGSTDPETSKGVSKRGNQAGSPPASGQSTAPATKPTGRE